MPAAFGRLCVETPQRGNARRYSAPAAFGRLCVETWHEKEAISLRRQPPSGGCVLKLHSPSELVFGRDPAAFGRLCVETSSRTARKSTCPPAAFGRLCVETAPCDSFSAHSSPAAFGRLCVETALGRAKSCTTAQPPSGGCVLKQRLNGQQNRRYRPSRLRAAVC